jgi:23S rRNA (cytosine1962-C5)-methyltransferase
MNNFPLTLLDRALAAREALFEPRHEAAFRLFNGFTEGLSTFAADLYGKTLVLHDYDEAASDFIPLAQKFYQERFPWIDAVVLKRHHAKESKARNGILLASEAPARKVCEYGVWYAVDLLLNRDASLYLDTRNLRHWILKNLRDKHVLNTFAYTGSLGVAAMAAGARRVLHIDLNRNFLNIAKTSYTLNGFPIRKADFQSGDFWPRTSRLIHEHALFDCVLLDPPFFAETPKGTVDAESNYARLINKVRPLIADGGCLVAVNNALYVSGASYMQILEDLCQDGYLMIEELVPVAEDFAGYESTRVPREIIDPAPFNHSTKIAVLRVRRKDGLKAVASG